MYLLKIVIVHRSASLPEGNTIRLYATCRKIPASSTVATWAVVPPRKEWRMTKKIWEHVHQDQAITLPWHSRHRLSAGKSWFLDVLGMVWDDPWKISSRV